MAELRAKSSLDSRGFNTGLSKMKGEVSKFSRAVSKIQGIITAAFAVVGVLRFGRSITKLGSQISDLALQSGLTTDEFQGLEVAAIKAGVSVEKIRTVTSKVNVVLGQAKSGMKTYVDLFERAGIAQEELIGLDAPRALELIAKKMDTATEGSQAFGAILEILGTRSGAQLKEVLQDIANIGLDGLTRKAKEAGDVIDSDLIQKLDKAEDTILIFQRKLKIGVANTLDFIAEKTRRAGKFWAILLGTGDFKRAAAVGANEEAAARAKEAARIAEQEAKKKQLAEEDRINFQAQEEEKLRKQAEKDAEKEVDRLLKRAKDFREEIEKSTSEEIRKEEAVAKKIAAIKRGEAAGLGGVGGEAADALARIGGTIGGQISPQAAIARRQLTVQREIAQAVRDLPPAIGKEITSREGLL